MPRIRCHYIDCIFLDDGYCGAAAIEVDPDVGCMTFSRADDAEQEGDWGDLEDEEIEDWEDVDVDDDEDDLWIDEDEF